MICPKTYSFKKDSVIVKIPLTEDVKIVLKKFNITAATANLIRHFNATILNNDMLEIEDCLDYEPDNDDSLTFDNSQSCNLIERNTLRKLDEEQSSNTIRARTKLLNFPINVDKTYIDRNDDSNNNLEKKFYTSERKTLNNYVEGSKHSQLSKENIKPKYDIIVLEKCTSSNLKIPCSTASPNLYKGNVGSNEATNNIELNSLVDLHDECSQNSTSNGSNKNVKNKLVLKEKVLDKKKKDFTITVSRDNRSLLNHMKHRHPIWSLKVNDFLQDDIVQLTSSDILSKITFGLLQENHSDVATAISGSESENRKTIYKLPPKRPSSRQINNDLFSTSADFNLSDSSYDSISLIASTTIEEQDATLQKYSESQINEDINNDQVNMDHKVQSWLNNNVIQSNTSLGSCTVPQIYRGLCYKHFFNNNCFKKKKCRGIHDFNDVLRRINIIDELNDDEFKKIHNFSMSKPLFYKIIYKHFIKMLIKRDMKYDFISIIHVFFDENNKNILVEGVTDVLDCLTQTDLGSFEEAVGYLLAGISINEYPMLGSVIFEIICNKGDIYQHWTIIKRLVYLGEKMSSKLGTRFLIILMKPPVNHQFCRDVYKLLQKYHFINMDEVAQDVVDAFKQLCIEHVPLSTCTESIKSGTSYNDFQDSLEFECHLPNENIQNKYTTNQLKPSFNPSTSFINAKKMMGIDYKTSSNLETNVNLEVFDYKNNTSSDTNSVDNMSSCKSYLNNSVIRTYNKKGLLYDPTNDYTPATKKSKTMSSLTDCDLRTEDMNLGVCTIKEIYSTSEVPDIFIENENDQNIMFCGDKSVNKPELLLRKTPEKPPEFPLFGELHFDPRYKFNVNLHHLYLEEINNIDMDKEDIIVLNNSIKNSNGQLFLNLLYKYKGHMTIQNFISMTLAHIIGTNQMMADIFLNLLESIKKSDPHYYSHIYTRVVLEVIIMNFLFELDKRNLFNTITDLLLTFSDWDSLVTSRLFINRKVSLIGRYLFIAKKLVYTKPEFTYEILVCNNLHLLEDCSKWPYNLNPLITGGTEADLKLRNAILTIFFTKAFLSNIIVVIQLYKRAFKTRIYNFDVEPFIDKMVVVLIKKHEWVLLKQIFYQGDLFYGYLSKNTMRAFLIIMFKHINEDSVFKLFHTCVERGIYQRLYNSEAVVHTVFIKTNMLDDEIKLILQLYFTKLIELKNLPSGSETLKFKICLPNENKSNEEIPMLNLHRSVQIINNVLRHYLMESYFLQSITSVPTLVEVTKEVLIEFLERPRFEI